MRAAFRLPPSAFTLVELLVVITIISMLVALLVPAVIAARGRARIGQCTNNQHELALAITQYEGAKKRLPGYANQILVAGSSPTAYRAISWVPPLLPFLGRNDLWEGANGWRSGNPSPQMSVRINELVCPDVAPTETCALTYVLNVGDASGLHYPAVDADLDPTNEPTRRALFRNLVPCNDAGFSAPRPISLSNVASPSQCPMISERAEPITPPSPITARVWDASRGPFASFAAADLRAAAVLLTPQQFGFTWPITNVTGTLVASQLPVIHRGIVIVTFCDGHTQSLSDDTDCSVYQSAIR